MFGVPSRYHKERSDRRGEVESSYIFILIYYILLCMLLYSISVHSFLDVNITWSDSQLTLHQISENPTGDQEQGAQVSYFFLILLFIVYLKVFRFGSIQKENTTFISHFCMSNLAFRDTIKRLSFFSVGHLHFGLAGIH